MNVFFGYWYVCGKLILYSIIIYLVSKPACSAFFPALPHPQIGFMT